MGRINEVEKMKMEKVRTELRARGYDAYDVLREKLKEIIRTEEETDTQKETEKETETVTAEGTHSKESQNEFCCT